MLNVNWGIIIQGMKNMQRLLNGIKNPQNLKMLMLKEELEIYCLRKVGIEKQ